MLKPFVRLLVLVMTISISAVFYFEKSLFAAGFASIPILPPLILLLGADAIAMAFARPTARANELPR